MIELSQSFGFEAAHTLERGIEAEGSARIHGHSYTGVLVMRGEPDPSSGMLIDLGVVAHTVARLREMLDHRLLNDVDGLGAGTMENLAAWIYAQAKPGLPALSRVAIRRESLGQACCFEPCGSDGASLIRDADWGVAKRQGSGF